MCTRKMDSCGLFLKKLWVVETCLFLGFVVGKLCFEIIDASRPGCSNPVGLEGTVEDSRFSSYTHMDGWDPFMARLFNVYAWCSATNDIQFEFLQIDVGNVRHISCIATQGVHSSYPLFSSYVMTFIIKYSCNETTWFPYKGNGGSVQIFDGNNDTSSVRYNYFRDTFNTRYLRIFPKTFYHRMCLRVELYASNDQSVPTPTPHLTTSTTSALTKAAPPVTINAHMSGSLTGHVTESHKVKATETSKVTFSPRSTYPFTKVAGNASVDPTIGRKDNPIDDRVMTGTEVVVVAAIILGFIAILLIAPCLYFIKDRNRGQQRNDQVELDQERTENVSETTSSTTGL